MSDELPGGEPYPYPSDETIRMQVEARVDYGDLERLAEQIETAVANAHRHWTRLETITDGYRDPVANGIFFAHRSLCAALYNLRQGQEKIYGKPRGESPTENPDEK